MLPLRYMDLYCPFFLIYDGSFSRNSYDAGPLILTQKKKIYFDIHAIFCYLFSKVHYFINILFMVLFKCVINKHETVNQGAYLILTCRIFFFLKD